MVDTKCSDGGADVENEVISLGLLDDSVDTIDIP